MGLGITEDYRVNWYRVKLPKGMMSELNRKSDLRGLFQAGGHFLLIIATSVLCYWVWLRLSWYWLLPALYLHGTVCSFCMNAVHELVHDTVFKTKWLNGFFACLFAWVGWINHYAFWLSHVEHHRFTLHDPHDSEVVVPRDVTLLHFGRAVFDPTGMWFYFSRNWHFAMGKPANDWFAYLFSKGKKVSRVFWWSRFLFVSHVTIAVVSIYFGYWIVPVVVSLSPIYGRSLDFLINEAQHIGLADHVNDFRLNSRTFVTNRLFEFLAWHMNYHLEHHMYMGVPCYRLRELHEVIEDELPHTCEGIVEVWWHLIAVMYRQRTEPGYVFVPRLPERDEAVKV
ncbi:fatty acid desaturase [Planctomycetota bacterium]|nr:fatty acid desaturase [Planctomycetota bacterium]